MKKIIIKKFSPLLLVLTMLVVGCDDDFLNINVNPNNPSSASLDLLLVAAQTSMGFETTRDIMEHNSIIARQFYNLSESQYNFGGTDFDNDWNAIYRDGLKEFNEVTLRADEQGLPGFAGIGRVSQAYLFSYLVDNFNDVPYSEALQGETNLFPAFDNASAIYSGPEGLIAMVDQAIANFNAALALDPIVNVSADLIYGSSTDAAQWLSWRKAAKTLKLKLLLNLRDVDAATATSGINALITGNDLITTASENFQFNWGTTVTPQNRHPLYQQEYEQQASTFYMDNWLMLQMVSRNDPRSIFYFFRQGAYEDFDFAAGGDPELTPCLQRSDCASWDALFALGVDGYWGRDHGDPSGIPGDGLLRTTFGLYPVGGALDVGPGGGSVAGTGSTSGASGAGITPWLTSAMTNLFIAEAELMLNSDAAAARTRLQTAIEQSMLAINSYASSVAVATQIFDADRDAYITTILGEYDAATTAGGRMNVIARELLISTYGNGIEGYNVVRRADAPTDLPASLSPLNSFPNRLPYANEELTSNPNAPATLPSFSDRIFWDVN